MGNVRRIVVGLVVWCVSLGINTLVLPHIAKMDATSMIMCACLASFLCGAALSVQKSPSYWQAIIAGSILSLFTCGVMGVATWRQLGLAEGTGLVVTEFLAITLPILLGQWLADRLQKRRSRA